MVATQGEESTGAGEAAVEGAGVAADGEPGWHPARISAANARRVTRLLPLALRYDRLERAAERVLVEVARLR
jgi:hypothetical protein